MSGVSVKFVRYLITVQYFRKYKYKYYRFLNLKYNKNFNYICILNRLCIKINIYKKQFNWIDIMVTVYIDKLFT